MLHHLFWKMLTRPITKRSLCAHNSGNRRMSERDLTRMGADGKSVGGPLVANNHLANSKSVPALHHHMGSGTICK